MNRFKGPSIDCVWIDEVPNPSVWQYEVGVIHVPPSTSPLNVPCWLALEAMRRRAAERTEPRTWHLGGWRVTGERRVSTEITDAYVRQFAEGLQALLDLQRPPFAAFAPKPKKPKSFEEWQKYAADLIEECQKHKQ